MIDQLKTLESMLLTIRKQYQQATEELLALKKSPQIDPAAHNTLKAKLEAFTKERQGLIKERDTLKSNLNELDRRYQSLAEAHHLIGEEQDKLQQQIDELVEQNMALTQKNDDLKLQVEKLVEKNRVAAEHTQVVFERLTQIDQMVE